MAVALSSKLPLMPADPPQPAGPAQIKFHSLLLIAAVLFGSSLQLWGPAWARTVLAQVRLNSPADFLALISACLLSVVAHELGHLYAAYLLNYELLGGAIGPLHLECWHNKRKMTFQPRQWLRCSISAVPRDLDSHWRTRMMVVVAAGPSVSLLILLASVSVSLNNSYGLATFWSACTEINFFLFALGLIPNGRFAALRNDAALFLALWKNGFDAADMFRCHQAIELSLRGIRPEHFPQSLLLELVSFPGCPYTRLVVARRMVEWAADSGNIKQAGAWDQAAVDGARRCGRRLSNRALAESACFDVLFREDYSSALGKFAQVDFAQLFPPSLADRAKAAHLLASRLPGQAGRHILRAQYHLPLGNSYYNFERRLLHVLHTRALSQTLTTSEC